MRARQIQLELLAVIHLAPGFEIQTVALLDARPGVGVGRVFELQLQQVVLDLLAPALVNFVVALGPREFFGVDHHAFVDGEIMLGIDERVGQRLALGHPFQEQVERVVGKVDIAVLHQVAEPGLVLAQLIDVGLREVELAGVQAARYSA